MKCALPCGEALRVPTKEQEEIRESLVYEQEKLNTMSEEEMTGLLFILFSLTVRISRS